jgi:tRNA-2-methylthio-N6-dimethylallyladenosine synthase
MKKKLYMKTYGCQMNVYDSARMVDLLSPLGYDSVDSPADADMSILNTCHIREKATEKVFSDLGRLKPFKDKRQAEGKSMIIAVAGCVAQAEGDEIMLRAPYVDMVFGPQTYHRLPEMIAQATRAASNIEGPGRGILDVGFPIESKFDSLPEVTTPQGATAFLTIQEGCDKFCHFCCVPYTRGAEYSRPVDAIFAEAQKLLDKGVKEITLLGQNVNAYHGQGPKGVGEWRLGQLMEHLADLKDLDRIRYMTSHPRDVDERLIAAHRDIAKVMPYLHLPVQSGSDRILQTMNRKHTAEWYLNVIEKLRKARPDIAFSSDFIVGYPGENAKDFEDTLALVKNVKYAQAYSFKYSPRQGTPAAALEYQVPEELKTERLEQLQALLREQQTAFNESLIGTIQAVLFEKPGRQPGQLIGRSPYLQSVHVRANPRLMGQIIDVKIVSATQNSLKGEIMLENHETSACA